MFDSLPLIIVTAKTRTAAAEIITEIIDDDATAEVRPLGHESPDRVWRINNKYYTALVRMHARADSDEVRVDDGQVGAHVALLNRDELQHDAAERRLQLCGPEAAVNVLACDADAMPDDLLALCARRRLEPAALREAIDASPGPFPEPRGVEAVRAALHAHPWQGLRRKASQAQSSPSDPPPEDPEGEEMEAERFAQALEALGGGAAMTAGLQGEERRAAAEQLVAAFAAAIGQPLGDFDLGL